MVVILRASLRNDAYSLTCTRSCVNVLPANGTNDGDVLGIDVVGDAEELAPVTCIGLCATGTAAGTFCCCVN